MRGKVEKLKGQKGSKCGIFVLMVLRTLTIASSVGKRSDCFAGGHEAAIVLNKATRRAGQGQFAPSETEIGVLC
jgi:hypothetical protein